MTKGPLRFVKSPSHLNVLGTLSGEHKTQSPVMVSLHGSVSLGFFRRFKRLYRTFIIPTGQCATKIELFPANLQRVSDIRQFDLRVTAQEVRQIGSSGLQSRIRLGRKRKEVGGS